MAPRFWTGKEGLHLTWLEPAGAGEWSRRRPRLWRLAARRRPRSGAWSVPRTVATSASFFRNWADTPGVAETAGGFLEAHWLERLGDSTYAYGVVLGRASAADPAFERLGLLHEDASPTEHGFVSWIPEGDGLRAFWLDGREMGTAEESEEEPAAGSMQLRTALVGAGGKAGASELVDDQVCECCQTDAAATASGPLVVYRNRAADEVRDIELRRREGAGWSAPTLVAEDGWKIPGCPVNGPAVVAHGEEVLVLYFTGAQERPRVQLAVSPDGGRHFGPPVLIDDQGPLGRVDLALAADGTAWMSWLERTPEGGRLQLRCRTARRPPGAAAGARHQFRAAQRRGAAGPGGRRRSSGGLGRRPQADGGQGRPAARLLRRRLRRPAGPPDRPRRKIGR